MESVGVSFKESEDDMEILPCIGKQVVTRYYAGKREFKTAWGAWCHLAKIVLLQEIRDEVYAKYRTIRSVHAMEVYDLDAEEKALFKKKYPSSHYDTEWGKRQHSDFFAAVLKKARELKNNAERGKQ